MTGLVAYRLVEDGYATRVEDAFDGEGARRYGGRWNSRGRHAIYLAGSEALALLEVLVHLQDPRKLADYRLFQVELLSVEVQRLDRSDLPEAWRDDPAPADTARIGDDWLAHAGKLALAVPSTVAVRDTNYLINPDHPAFPGVVAETVELDLRVDPRLLHDAHPPPQHELVYLERTSGRLSAPDCRASCAFSGAVCCGAGLPGF